MSHYRLEINIFFDKKKEGNAGYIGIYAVTSNSLDSAKKKVLNKIKLGNTHTKYRLEMKEAYEVDLQQFPPKGYKYSGNPNKEGIWGEWKIYFKNM